MATLNILYEDPHILVCVKPHGIATQSKSIRYPDMVSLIKNHLAKASGTSGKSGAPKSIGSRTPGSAEPYLAVIHRLDQPVAGILVFAKTPAAAKDLNKQYRIRDSGNITGHLLPIHLQQKKEHLRIIWSKMPEQTLPVSVLRKKTDQKLHGCIMIQFLLRTGCLPHLLLSTELSWKYTWIPAAITRSAYSLPTPDIRSSVIKNMAGTRRVIFHSDSAPTILVLSILLQRKRWSMRSLLRVLHFSRYHMNDYTLNR